MAVRLREADNIAAMAELQQQISELEIQVQIRTKFSQHNTCHHNLVLSQSIGPIQDSSLSKAQLLIDFLSLSFKNTH